MTDHTLVTVVSGPTAVGKGTVVAALKRAHPEVWVSVSATTRAARPGEIDGDAYVFVTEAEFDRLVESGEMLEWACVHKVARYGTPRRPVLEALAAGRQVILEIEPQGARQVRTTMPDARFIFLTPPSWDHLVARLVGRGTEDAEQRERRLETARAEIARADEYDHVVVNDELGTTVRRLVELLGLTDAPGAGASSH